MEEDKKNTTTGDGYDISSITGVLNTLLAAFNIPLNVPHTPLPPQMIMTGSRIRPGLSAKQIAADIVSRQSDAGRVAGNVFADGDNVEEEMELIRVEAIINALLNDAVVNVVIPQGISVITTGVGNLGAPVVSQGATTNMGIGNGIIQ